MLKNKKDELWFFKAILLYLFWYGLQGLTDVANFRWN